MPIVSAPRCGVSKGPACTRITPYREIVVSVFDGGGAKSLQRNAATARPSAIRGRCQRTPWASHQSDRAFRRAIPQHRPSNGDITSRKRSARRLRGPSCHVPCEEAHPMRTASIAALPLLGLLALLTACDDPGPLAPFFASRSGAPLAPTNLVATPYSFEMITFSWQDNANNEGGVEVW